MVADLPAVVIHEAVREYSLHGYDVEFPTVEVSPNNTRFAALAHWDEGRLELSEYTAGNMRILARVMAKPTAKLRAAAYRSCNFRCVYGAQLALHEVAHFVQARYGGYSQDLQRNEGIAEAVADDLHAGFVRRIVGPDVRGCHRPRGCDTKLWRLTPNYPQQTIAIRLESAAAVGKSWRSPDAQVWRTTQLAYAPPAG